MWSASPRTCPIRRSLVVSDSPGRFAIQASTSALGNSSSGQPSSPREAAILAMTLSSLSHLGPTALLSAT